MVKFSTTLGDKKLLGLGLSAGNVDKLKQGQPILIKNKELQKLTGWNGYIVIMYGVTENAIANELKRTWNLKL